MKIIFNEKRLIKEFEGTFDEFEKISKSYFIVNG